MLPSIAAWLNAHVSELIFTGIVLAVYLVVDLATAPNIRSSADGSGLKGAGGKRAVRIVRFFGAVVGCLVLAIVWGVNFSAVFVFATTILTLLGVALFAQWSLASNITAYLILLLHPSFARGNFIRIIDGDNYIEGFIADMNLFSTRLISENREVIVYPNNLILGRPALINPRSRLFGIGKIEKRNDAPAPTQPDQGEARIPVAPETPEVPQSGNLSSAASAVAPSRQQGT
ncbi:MAG: mechanosensitive ion channel domain-containing protein [Pseudomonadota bacterium]